MKTILTCDAENNTAYASPQGIRMFAACAVLIALADFLFFGRIPGATSMAIFSAALIMVSLPLEASFYKGTARKLLLAASVLSVLALAYDLSVNSVCLVLFFCVSLRISVLLEIPASPLRRMFQVFIFYATLPFELLQRYISPLPGENDHEEDCETSEARKKTTSLIGKYLLIWMIVIPIMVLFCSLFAVASPNVRHIFNAVWMFIAGLVDMNRFVFWGVAFGFVFAFLRMRFLASLELAPKGVKPYEPAEDSQWTKSFLLSALAAFNIVFLVQNFSDLCWLAGGMVLPEATTYSEYANQGAWALAVATLIAAAFIVACFRPRKNDSSWRILRVLAYVWIVQNIFLIFSASMRMVDYVWVYGLTDVRLMGFSFFALVAAGFALTVYKIAKNRSTSWLIGTNTCCVAAVFLIWGLVDFKAITADYNVSRYAADKGYSLDMDYFQNLGPSALPAAKRLHAILENEQNDGTVKNVKMTAASGSVIDRAQAMEKLEKNIADAKLALECNLADWRRASLKNRLIKACLGRN